MTVTFSVGLALATFATLVLEILDARLLSVLTWYHLSFFAVSLAMLGMAAGAVRVFLGGPRYAGGAARPALARLGRWFAIAIAASHVVNLVLPIPPVAEFNVMEAVAVLAATAVLAVPFFLSGMVVTIALTRCGGPVGWLYAMDLAGAAAGCLLVVPLLDRIDLSSAALLTGAAAAAGAWMFERNAPSDARGGAMWMAGALALAACANAALGPWLMVAYAKGRPLAGGAAQAERTAWNSHSFVVVQRRQMGDAFLWGRGRLATPRQVELAWMLIDGEAGTPMTGWNGDPAALDWVAHDVTSLPYHLRRGRVAVIGVGGGRDILSAIWSRSPSIAGVEINGILLDVLRGSHRRFTGVADRPGVALVHDEARSWLTRTAERFDVIQMSLIDTWAATGAGAFTLSENGLYTREAWTMFLERLTGSGLLSVSRWFNPSNVSETNRLLALGVAALLDRGAARPADHLVMASRGPTATLLVSPAPLGSADRDALLPLADREAFSVLVSPWTAPASERLARIVASRSPDALAAAVADPDFDYRAPDDRRPFFFNMLKPASFRRAYDLPRGGVIWGNIRATATLVVLFAVALVLVSAIIVWPLARAGIPAGFAGLPGPRRSFLAALAYFGAIGLGFMFVQIALLQRFSLLLGHPAYALAIVLFTMILAASAGSAASDRLDVERRAPLWLPAAIAAALIAATVAVPAVAAAAAARSLAGRTLAVVLVLAPVSVLLGFCFPVGMRLVSRRSPDAAAWMWGVNGACGVLASIAAVAVSMWIAIDANLWIAAVLYASLTVWMKMLSNLIEPNRT